MKVLSTRAAQRWLATSIALFVGSTHALQLEDISNKSAAIYTDIQVTAQHQYYIGTVFDSLNKYLCSLAQNRHEKYANFMSGFAGSAQAYRATQMRPPAAWSGMRRKSCCDAGLAGQRHVD